MKRRTLLGGIGAAGLASLAGCLGLAGMDRHEASPVGVDPDVRRETGYDGLTVEQILVEEDVPTDTISVENYSVEHDKEISLQPLGSQRSATFVVLTTPKISIAGRNFNPVEDKSAQELIDLVGDNYDDISNIEHDEDDEIEVLNQMTDRSRFIADATFDGHDLEVDLHVCEAVEAGEDLLVAIGVYPRDVRGQEESNIIALMEGIDTDVDLDDAETPDDDDESGDDDADDDTDDGEADDDGGFGALD